MKTEQQVPIKELRGNLKQVFAKEIEKLPDYLNQLPTKDKLDCLIKIMPFVFPKVNTVSHNSGESTWEMDIN